MNTVQAHYENFLAGRYTWMCGGHSAKAAEQLRFLEQHIRLPAGGGKALDLGCGSGFQALALARMGFEVTAVDTNAELLKEVRLNADKLRVRTIQGDMRDKALYSADGPFDAAVCMGDTLTHLESFDQVEALLRDVRACLADEGKLVLGFRELTQELLGIQRAIPVRADADRIFTTFLEYESEHVNVHDMVYERVDGGWRFSAGAYKKLRLDAARVTDAMQRAGFGAIEKFVERGFTTLIGRLK